MANRLDSKQTATLTKWLLENTSRISNQYMTTIVDMANRELKLELHTIRVKRMCDALEIPYKSGKPKKDTFKSELLSILKEVCKDRPELLVRLEQLA